MTTFSHEEKRDDRQTQRQPRQKQQTWRRRRYYKQLYYIKDFIVGILFCITMIHNFYSSSEIMLMSSSSSSSNSISTNSTKQLVSSSSSSLLSTTILNDVPIENQFIQKKHLDDDNVNDNYVNDSINKNYNYDYNTTIPLDILTDSYNRYDCPKSTLFYVPDRIIDNNNVDYNGHRKIPRIVHMTSKSRCMTKSFINNIQHWYFTNHSFYLHDDIAVDKLLTNTKFYEDFPHLSLTSKCLRSGASKTDLWRYLLLWEYGGIYTDIDNAPGNEFFKKKNKKNNINKNDDDKEIIISDDDDAFFVVEKLGILSQYFMAISPKHPLMYLAVQVTLHRILNVDHIGKQYIPAVTGPGALKVAFKYFMRTQSKKDKSNEGDDEYTHHDDNDDENNTHDAVTTKTTNNKKNEKKKKESSTTTTTTTKHYGRVKEGIYYGVGNRSVTVIGTKENGWKYINRGSVKEKIASYIEMNMKHYSHVPKKKFNESCFVHLYSMAYDTVSYSIDKF